PFTVLRRLDCVLQPTKNKVMEQLPKLKKMNIQNLDPVINRITGQTFHNTSKYDFSNLLTDSDNLAANLMNYINGFSSNARDIFTDYFKFQEQIERLDQNNLLYKVFVEFANIDLHPDRVKSIEMGYIFEELI